MKKYMICGYVSPELCVELGEFETKYKLTEIWQLIIQIYQDGSYPEGIIARRIK